MNKKRLIFVFLTVLVLTTFVFSMALPANATTPEEEHDILIMEEEIDALLGNPLTWLFGALLLIIVAIIDVIYTIFTTIIAAILAVISAFVGVFIFIFNSIASLF